MTSLSMPRTAALDHLYLRLTATRFPALRPVPHESSPIRVHS